MRAVGWSGFVAGLLVAWVTTAGAQENGFAGRKLVIVDKYDVSGRAKLVFVSKDGTPGAIHHGAAASPPALSGTVEVFPLQDPGNRAVYQLGAGGWLIQAATVARYVNRDAAPGGAGVRVLSAKPGSRLKVVAKNLGDGDAATTDEGGADLDLRALAGNETIRVVVTLENAADASMHVMCADFVAPSLRPLAGGTGRKYVSTTAMLPVGPCAVSPTTTSTAPTSTSSSSTSSSTSTTTSTTTTAPPTTVTTTSSSTSSSSSSTTSTSSSTTSTTFFVAPAKIAAIGDSITQAFAADCTCNLGFDCILCIIGGDQPENSWFDGDSNAVFSVHDRYKQLDSSVRANKGAAVDGAEMRGGSDNFAGQAVTVLSQAILPEHVEIELGGNDICSRDCLSGCSDDLYTEAEWRQAVRNGLDILVAGLPLGSTIYLHGMPRVHDLRAAGLVKEAMHSNVICAPVWSTFGVCEIATSGGTFGGAGLTERLTTIGARQQRYNEIIREEVLAYDANTTGQNPRGIEVVTDYVDEQTLSVGTFSFGPNDIDGGDCFHPSVQGQNIAAQLAWDSNPNRP